MRDMINSMASLEGKLAFSSGKSYIKQVQIKANIPPMDIVNCNPISSAGLYL